MVAFNDIEKFSRALVQEFHPHRIFLFGSHATGKARDDSDVDILVTMDYNGNSLRAAAQIIRKIKPRFAVDLIIRTEKELNDRIEQNDDFLKEVSRNGHILYESHN